MQRTVTTTITEDYCDVCNLRMHIVKLCVVCRRECCSGCCQFDCGALDEVCIKCRGAQHKFRDDFDAIEARRDKDRAAVIEKWREAVKAN